MYKGTWWAIVLVVVGHDWTHIHENFEIDLFRQNIKEAKGPGGSWIWSVCLIVGLEHLLHRQLSKGAKQFPKTKGQNEQF